MTFMLDNELEVMTMNEKKKTLSHRQNN